MTSDRPPEGIGRAYHYACAEWYAERLHDPKAELPALVLTQLGILHATLATADTDVADGAYTERWRWENGQ